MRRSGFCSREPIRTRRKKEEAASKTAFRLLADEYLGKLRREGRAEQTMRKITWLMDMANASIGDKPIREITAPMVLEALRVLESRGHYESARLNFPE